MSKRRSSTPELNTAALSRMNMRDMLILPDTASQVMTDMARFHDTDASVDGAALEVASREAIESAYGFGPQGDDERKPFIYQDGVAVIPIHGTLLNRCNSSWGFVTGYQYVRRMMNLALEDDDVETIVFDVDSPGGEAAGCFELAREIMASRRVKPSLAMVDSVAASGGIALAACASVVYAIPSARVGSIGVYRMHVSFEEAHKKEGVKITFATAGDHKIDGNPYQDLPQSVLDEWKQSAGRTWDDFITLIAEARDLTEEEVRGTQARIYRADEALDKGLINAVKTPTEAVAAFLAELADETSQDDEEEASMTDKTKEVTSALTEADITRIATIAAEAGAKAAATVSAKIERKQSIRDHAASIGPAASALAKTIIDNDLIDADAGIAMLDAAFGGKSAHKPGKGKAKVAAVADDEDEGDADEGEGEGDDEGEGEGDDEGEEAARSSRKRGVDKVNHLDAAMGRSKQPNVGGGKGKGKDGNQSEGGGDQRNPLLVAHAAVTGSNWSRQALKDTAH